MVRSVRARAFRCVSAALLSALSMLMVLGGRLAIAQPAPPAASSAPAASAAPVASSAPAAPGPAAAPSAEGPTPQMKEEARSHFTKGLGLMGEGAYSAALAEFLVSLDLFPTRNATLNAAYC